MPNWPVVQLRRHVLAGLAGQASSKSWMAAAPFRATALIRPRVDPVDQVGAAAGLDDVAAQRGDDGPAVVRGPGTGGRGPGAGRWPPSCRGRVSSQSADGGRRPPTRLAEVLGEHLGGPRRQVVGLQAVQVEGFHGAPLSSGLRPDVHARPCAAASSKRSRSSRPASTARRTRNAQSGRPPSRSAAASPGLFASSPATRPPAATAPRRRSSSTSARRVGVVVGKGAEGRHTSAPGRSACGGTPRDCRGRRTPPPADPAARPAALVARRR